MLNEVINANLEKLQDDAAAKKRLIEGQTDTQPPITGIIKGLSKIIDIISKEELTGPTTGQVLPGSPQRLLEDRKDQSEQEASEEEPTVDRTMTDTDWEKELNAPQTKLLSERVFCYIRQLQDDHEHQKSLKGSELIEPKVASDTSKAAPSDSSTIELFSAEFVAETWDYDRSDVESMVQYIVGNRQLKSPLIIGYEITEILYQNERNKRFLKRRLISQVMSVLQLPIEVVTYFTIMPRLTFGCHIPKVRLMFYPLFGSYFIAFVLTHGSDLNNSWFLFVFLLNFIASSIYIYPVVFSNKIPSRPFFRLVLFNNLLCSFLWFYMFADMILEVFVSMHILFGYRYLFFTISLFSFFIWIPPINGALMTVKYMKFVPGYNGAVFNTIFVFGFCCIIHNSFSGQVISRMWPITVNLEANTVMLFFIFNALVLPMTFMFIRQTDFKYNRKIGCILTTIYFCVVSIVFAIAYLVPI